MNQKPSDSEQLSDEEAVKRRDEVIRRMANTKPQPKTPTKAKRDVKEPVKKGAS